MSSPVCDDPKHKGHRRYVGGIMDGQVDHLLYAHPSDFPTTKSTLLRQGQRSHYRLDADATKGTEAVYRCFGHTGPPTVQRWEPS